MLSSTFNFKGVIFKAGAIFLGLVLIYSLLIRLFFSTGGKGLNQWQENRIRLQNYAYTSPVTRCVVLGSSLASRINEDQLDSSDRSLAISGGNSLTGLAVVIKTKPLPQCVVVEANATLVREEDKVAIAEIFQPVRFFFRKHLPLMRETYQPVVLVGSYLKKRTAISVQTDQVVSNFAHFLKSNKDYEAAPLSAEKTDPILNDLAQKLETLASQGVRVFLFDIPRHPEIAQSPQNIAFQKLLHQHFDGKYEFLELKSDFSFQTEDSNHLTRSSAVVFTELLRANIHSKMK